MDNVGLTQILTLATRELPGNVLCGYEQYSVKKFYPNPLRCGICCEFGHTKNWCNMKENPICRDCAAPIHTGLCMRPKKCVNCNSPDDNHNHGSYDKDYQVRVTEMVVIKIKMDLGISYELARKKFEE
jgi:hypothetical protein